MRDQATELRNLVLRSARIRTAEVAPAPRLITVSGGKRGVGVTTLALNLAAALSELGARVVLVDADFESGDVAQKCQLVEGANVADVMEARRDIHEVLQRGPGGLLVVPGTVTGERHESSEVGQHRLLRQCQTLGRHADLVVLDAGNGATKAVRRFWQAADDVALVTTPEAVSVMDAYATLKTHVSPRNNALLHLVVNRATEACEAEDVHRRIDQSCRRFLGFGIQWLGHLPVDPEVTASGQRRTPFVDDACPAAHAINQLAQQLNYSRSHARAS